MLKCILVLVLVTKTTLISSNLPSTLMRCCYIGVINTLCIQIPTLPHYGLIWEWWGKYLDYSDGVLTTSD